MAATAEAVRVDLVWQKVDGARFHGHPSDAAINEMGCEVNRILTDCGGMDLSRAVVLAAKDPQSPLHEQFEWDVERAAWSEWIRRANELVRSFRPVPTQEFELVGARGRVSHLVAIPIMHAIEAGLVDGPEPGEPPPAKYITVERTDARETVTELIARQDVQELYDLLPRIDCHDGEDGGPDLRFLSKALRKAARLVGIL